MDKQIHCLASEIVKQLFFGILLHCMLEQAQKNAPIISGHQLVIQNACCTGKLKLDTEGVKTVQDGV